MLPGVGTGALGLQAPDVAGLATSVWRDTGTVATEPGRTLETVAGILTGLLVGTVVLVLAWRALSRRRLGVRLLARRDGDQPAGRDAEAVLGALPWASSSSAW